MEAAQKALQEEANVQRELQQEVEVGGWMGEQWGHSHSALAHIRACASRQKYLKAVDEHEASSGQIDKDLQHILAKTAKLNTKLNKLDVVVRVRQMFSPHQLPPPLSLASNSRNACCTPLFTPSPFLCYFFCFCSSSRKSLTCMCWMSRSRRRPRRLWPATICVRTSARARYVSLESPTSPASLVCISHLTIHSPPHTHTHTQIQTLDNMLRGRRKLLERRSKEQGNKHGEDAAGGDGGHPLMRSCCSLQTLRRPTRPS